MVPGGVHVGRRRWFGFDGAGVMGARPCFVSVNGRIAGVNGILKF